MLDVAFVKPALPRGGALVLPMAENSGLGGLAADLDAAAGGAVKRALAAAEFKGRKGQSCTVWTPLPEGQPGPTRIVAVGLGKAEELSAEAAEAAGGAALPLVRSEREATVAADGMAPEFAAAFGFGMALRSYRFDRYRTTEKDEDKPKLQGVSIATGSARLGRPRVRVPGRRCARWRTACSSRATSSPSHPTCSTPKPGRGAAWSWRSSACRWRSSDRRR